ncbi:hypothetical protein [Leuconostoc sp. MTCC 10508]|uniref:hypothetical protein n=1 Tax=Leuconostoc sp. MTCC 10508 TaxID=2698683 RepID=UPI0020BF0171|nr:hypothetical protein [Leuconostoc sp. MTCC 10508]
MNDSKHYVQVKIPKVPRWLDNVLIELQTKNYRSFKTDFSKFGVGVALSENRDEEKYKYLCENAKTIDLAMALGVWEIAE